MLVLVLLGAPVFFWLLQSALSEAEPTDEPPTVVVQLPDPEPDPGPPPPDLQGRVVNQRTGLAIPGVPVSARCDGEDEPFLTVTNAEGRYRLDTLPVGACDLSARGDRHVAAGPVGEARLTVSRPDDSPLEGIDLYLYEASRIQGRVMASEAPAAGAHLSLLYLEAPGGKEAFSVTSEVKTGPDGRFELKGLGPGRLQVLAEHDNHGLAEGEMLFLHAGETLTDVVIHLVDVGALEGRVLDTSGRGIPDATVSYRRDTSLQAKTMQTDAEGRYRFTNVRAGLVTVVAHAHGYERARRPGIRVDIDQSAEAVLRLKARTGYGGTVLSPAGEAVGGAQVFVGAQSAPAEALAWVARTDPKGRFWVDTAPAPPAVIQARHRRHGPSAPQGVAGSERDLLLELTEGGKLVGEVVDGSGDPIVAYTVWLLGQRGSFKSRSPDGRFKSHTLQPGRYGLSIEVSGRPDVRTSRFVVTAGQTTDVGRIVVGMGGAVSGRALSADTGEPLAGVFVNGESGRGGTTTGPDGRFKLTALSDETRSLWLRKEGHVARMISGLRAPESDVLDLGDLMITPQKDPNKPRMQYSGVGIQVQFAPGRILVDRVFEGGPAGRNGLERGTAILEINGFSVDELTPRQAIEMMRGESGTEVSLGVQRPGSPIIETVAIERGEVEAGH